VPLIEADPRQANGPGRATGIEHPKGVASSNPAGRAPFKSLAEGLA